MKKKFLTVKDITLIGLFLALFFISSNIIPTVMLVGAVPFTLQILVILLAGSMLKLKKGLIFIVAMFLLTAAGLPMMSGFKGGLAALLGPTAGFIWGWTAIIIIMGTYSIFLSEKFGKFSILGYILFALIAIIIDYACGAAVLTVKGSKAFFPVFLSLYVFLPADILKILLAAVLDNRIKKAVKID